MIQGSPRKEVFAELRLLGNFLAVLVLVLVLVLVVCDSDVDWMAALVLAARSPTLTPTMDHNLSELNMIQSQSQSQPQSLISSSAGKASVSDARAMHVEHAAPHSWNMHTRGEMASGSGAAMPTVASIAQAQKPAAAGSINAPVRQNAPMVPMNLKGFESGVGRGSRSASQREQAEPAARAARRTGPKDGSLILGRGVHHTGPDQDQHRGNDGVGDGRFGHAVVGASERRTHAQRQSAEPVMGLAEAEGSTTRAIARLGLDSGRLGGLEARAQAGNQPKQNDDDHDQNAESASEAGVREASRAASAHTLLRSLEAHLPLSPPQAPLPAAPLNHTRVQSDAISGPEMTRRQLERRQLEGQADEALLCDGSGARSERDRLSRTPSPAAALAGPESSWSGSHTQA
eukprot:1754590-Rhodomonas_salina.2